MKKFLILIAVMVGLTFTLSAQSVRLAPIVTGDTLLNTGSVSKVIPVSGGYAGISFQPKLYRSVTGGTWAGRVVLYHSNDGSLYRSTGDTLLLASDSTVIWNKAAPNPGYYKIIASGATTINAAFRLYYRPVLNQTP